MASKREYKARCHCGRIRFSFFSEEITTGIRCNCSICIRKGAVMSSSYIPAEDFRAHARHEDFHVYLWNDRVMEHLACKTCGISPYHGDDSYGYRVNLGCVEGLDALTLAIKVLDGRSMEIAPDPGPYPGDQT
jgi:hypothetical protein